MDLNGFLGGGAAFAIVIAIVVIILLAVWCVTTSNRLVRAGIKVREGLSGIEVALTKRYDMLTKLADAARRFAEHEARLMAETVRMRQGMTLAELNSANAQADALAGRIHAVAEAYPELRSSDVYCGLQRGIMDAEEHLQAARRLYNSNAAAFNTLVRVFPSCIVASAKGLREEGFFEAEAAKRVDVGI